MASSLVDLVKINITSTGTGPLKLGSAVTGFRGTEALINGRDYSYSIQQGANWEVGRGTWLSASSQMVRQVLYSSNGGIAIALKTGAQVSFVPVSADLDAVQLAADAHAAALDALAYSEQSQADANQVAIDRAFVGSAAQTVVAGMSIYDNAYASTLPKGVTSVTIGGTAITGATVGTYPLTFSGGSITGMVANLVVTSATTARVDIINTGLGSGTTPPTVTIPSGATLPVGTTLTAVVGAIIVNQQKYWAVSSNGSQFLLCGNNGGSFASAPFGGTQVTSPSGAWLASTFARSQNAIPFATWSALASATGMLAGDRARVRASDTGTHTDPVVGGTVNNAGDYTYSASPAGWQRTGDLDSQTAAAIVAAIASTYPTIGEWLTLTVDSTNRIVSGLKYDGTQWEARGGVLVQVQAPKIVNGVPTFAAISAPGVAIDYPTTAEWKSLVLDSTGRIVSGTKQDGSTYEARAGALVKTSGASANPARTYTYNVLTGTNAYDPAVFDLGILVVGQSLAQGTSVQAGGVITASAEHPGYALMSSIGVRYDGQAFSTYADLVESVNGTLKETICGGMADAIMRKTQADLGLKQRIVFGVCAYGGQAYYGSQTISDGGLKRGSKTNNSALAWVKNCRDISAAAGKRFIVLAVVTVHGEEDYKLPTPNRLYTRALVNWRRNLEEDIREITGQVDTLRMYCSQPQRAQTLSVGVDLRTPQAILDAMDLDPNIMATGPIYFGDDGGDGSHPAIRSYRRMGEQIGDALRNDLFGAYWSPVRALKAYWVSSNVIRLEYGRTLAIESDNTNITLSTLGAGKGIDFTDGSGSPPTVTGIALSLSNTAIDVTLSGTPTGLRPQIFIGARTTTAANSIGRVDGARTGIREATSYDTDPNDGAVLYHWACHQQIAL